MTDIALTQLRAHPLNSNVMPSRLFDKLVEQIRRSGRCPPLIVRPLPRSGDEPQPYQVLDGHHRWRALETLGDETAPCVVWAVDDTEALVLLSTLNRLEGADAPHARAKLVGVLQEQLRGSAGDLAALLPETTADVKRLLALNGAPPTPAPPPSVESMRVAVNFFVLPEQKRRLDIALTAVGGERNEALMKLIDHATDDHAHET